jgi:hypothetical protein
MRAWLAVFFCRRLSVLDRLRDPHAVLASGKHFEGKCWSPSADGRKWLNRALPLTSHKITFTPCRSLTSRYSVMASAARKELLRSAILASRQIVRLFRFPPEIAIGEPSPHGFSTPT